MRYNIRQGITSFMTSKYRRFTIACYFGIGKKSIIFDNKCGTIPQWDYDSSPHGGKWNWLGKIGRAILTCSGVGGKS